MVVTHPGGTKAYSATRPICASNGQAVTHAIRETREWDGVEGHSISDYDIEYGNQFRYDGPRQRYLVRKLDPAGLLLTPPEFNPVEDGRAPSLCS